MKTRSFFGSLLLLAVVAAAMGGCAAVNPTIATLDKAKTLSAEGRYAAAADLDFDCTEADEGCGQLYLITGDACYRLARAADAAGRKEAAKNRYACTADRLEAGIARTTEWASTDVRARYYENLCEALRNWQDLESGESARIITRRLSAASERFLAQHPGHRAAVYFWVSARFSAAAPELLDPTDPEKLCGLLNQMIRDLEETSGQAGGTRYEENHRRLLIDIKGAKQTVAGCR